MLLWIKPLTPAQWSMVLHYYQVSFTQIWMYFSSLSKHNICPTWNSGMLSNSVATSPLQETIQGFSPSADWITVKWYFDRGQMWFLTHPNGLQQISILSSKYLVYKLSPHLEVYHCNSGILESYLSCPTCCHTDTNITLTVCMLTSTDIFKLVTKFYC